MTREPQTVDELFARARSIAGRALASIAAEHGLPFAGRGGARTKGKTGELLERILGASGGSGAVHDFPAIGVELKSIPVDASLRPRESTYVCTLPMADAEHAEWSTSWARAKLAHVLWMPVVVRDDDEPRLGTPLLWMPTAEQAAILGGDFDEAMGAIAIGGIEGLSARTGRWLHVRPKAASSRDRAWSPGEDASAWVATNPRGFYLRPRFTGALLLDPAATP